MGSTKCVKSIESICCVSTDATRNGHHLGASSGDKNKWKKGLVAVLGGETAKRENLDFRHPSRSIWARIGIDLGMIKGRFGVGLASIWIRSEIDLGGGQIRSRK